MEKRFLLTILIHLLLSLASARRSFDGAPAPFVFPTAGVSTSSSLLNAAPGAAPEQFILAEGPSSVGSSTGSGGTGGAKKPDPPKPPKPNPGALPHPDPLKDASGGGPRGPGAGAGSSSTLNSPAAAPSLASNSTISYDENPHGAIAPASISTESTIIYTTDPLGAPAPAPSSTTSTKLSLSVVHGGVYCRECSSQAHKQRGILGARVLLTCPGMELSTGTDDHGKFKIEFESSRVAVKRCWVNLDYSTLPASCNFPSLGYQQGYTSHGLINSSRSRKTSHNSHLLYSVPSFTFYKTSRTCS